MPLRWFLALITAWLAGCASAPPPPAPLATGLLHDSAFAPPAAPVDAAQVFALTDAMRTTLEQPAIDTLKSSDPRRRLLHQLFGERAMGLDYDAAFTRTASEAFEAQRGNCLSLMVMTAAFARAAGIPVKFRQVKINEAWSRSNGFYFASGHVNLGLGWALSSVHKAAGENQMIVDFLPDAAVRDMPVRVITEATVLAMFMNNRAAESLARGQVDDAYWFAREALRQDPGFIAAYNTLGVVYSQRGRPAWAETVYQAVLAREPDNTHALANLVLTLRADGRRDEAAQVQARLTALEPHPPFHFLQLGQQAMQRQDWQGALDLFRKELARQADNPELHFWLAQASYRLGNLREADRHMELARTNSATPQDAALYNAKLGWLRAKTLHQ